MLFFWCKCLGFRNTQIGPAGWSVSFICCNMIVFLFETYVIEKKNKFFFVLCELLKILYMEKVDPKLYTFQSRDWSNAITCCMATRCFCSTFLLNCVRYWGLFYVLSHLLTLQIYVIHLRRKSFWSCTNMVHHFEIYMISYLYHFFS